LFETDIVFFLFVVNNGDELLKKVISDIFCAYFGRGLKINSHFLLSFPFFVFSSGCAMAQAVARRPLIAES
jgi:predicted acyltransferase